uniref:Uncharacterized protein n=2 Tax=Panagrolaimus sp. JU765 TaxID=591449 RepID=A0AC34RP26_9BILA
MLKLKLLTFVLGCFLINNAGVLAMPKTMKMVMGDTGTSGSRYAVLSAYFATGSKNVRWETVPMNVMDQNGKAVPQTSSGKNGNYGCLDIAGKQQENGAEYLRPSGKFKYKCNNGIEEVVGKQKKLARKQFFL